MSAPYYLPLTYRSAKNFIEARESFVEPIEAAGMFAAFSFLKEKMRSASLGRMIREAYPLFKKHPDEGHAQLLGALDISELCNVDVFVSQLMEAEVTLTKQERIIGRAWLAPDGNYSCDFQSACIACFDDYELTFYDLSAGEVDNADQVEDDEHSGERTRYTVSMSGTRDQSVVARIVASAPDERIVIEAYAGTGKTFLIHALNSNLRGGFTYVAPSKAHIFGFEAHASASRSAGVSAITIFKLAINLAQNHARASGLRFTPNLGRSEYPLSEQAQMAGVIGISGDSPAIVMGKLKRAILSWCGTDDPVITERHFYRSGARSQQDIRSFINAAKRLWMAMFSAPPQRGKVFDIQPDHVAKWLAVRNAEVPTTFGTFLVDEAHDLSPSWRHLFERYAGGCILMGDPHQRLRGKMMKSERAKYALMTTSLRTGLGAHDLIEQTLQLAPERTMPDFDSSGDHFTRLRRYNATREIPDEGLRLYGNEWALLAAALRLKAVEVPISLLPESKRTMENSVRNAIALFDGRELGYRVDVNGCVKWDDLALRLERQNLSAIIRLFEKGFDEANLADLTRYESQGGRSKIALGLIDHAKNLEFSTVALAPCCYEDAAVQRGFQPVHASYLGMTRARDELWVPGDAVDRLNDLRISMQE